MSQRVLLIIAAVFFVGLAGFLWFGRGEPEGGAVRKDLKIIAFGDSLVAGQGATSGKDFVSLVADNLGVEIINAGVGGDTTATGKARLQADVLEQKPDVVILLLGGNDALRRIPEQQTFGNLSQIIDSIEARGAKVLLLGIRGGLLSDSYKKNFETLAEQKNVAFVPNILEGIFGRGELMADGIHPNDAGYKKIAERVQIQLKNMLIREFPALE